jgi:imidazolonepropionase-like amidohydrolase
VTTVKFRILIPVLLLALAVGPSPAPAAGDVLAVKAERIYTAAGEPVVDGVILIENGKIKAVGKDLDIPAGARLLRAKVVIPGLIDIHTHLGVYSLPMVAENSDGNEMTNPVTPQVRALDSFNFDDPAIAVGRAAGVTTIVSRPGSANVIGGTSVAVKLKNASPDEMILVEDCDLKMALEGNPIGVYGAKKQMPVTMMGVYHLARKAFLEAQEYRKSWETYEKDKAAGKNPVPPKRDLGKDNLVKALRREIPVHIHCATASEVVTSIRLADEFNLRLSLGHCYWAYLIVDDLRDRRDVHFNVGPPMFFTYFDNHVELRNGPAILAEAGLKVSLQTDALGGGQQNLRHLAALCVRYGMTEDDALKAITIREAEAVGLEDRIGSIEPGKDADLVFLDGEPFEFLTGVEKVLIDGRVEFERPAEEPAPLRIKAGSATGALEIPDAVGAGSSYAIKAGTLLTMAGAPVANGVVLVKDGKIEKAGAGLAVPEGYAVIDAGGFTVMPGLISPRSSLGITTNWRNQSSLNESSSPITPEMDVRHAVEPQAPLFAYARQLGITSVLVTPGNLNVIGGRGAALKTVGDVVDRMIIKDQAAMVFGFGVSAKRKEQSPMTRMGLAALLRDNLVKAREYGAARERYEKDKKGTEPARDLAMEALLPVLRGAMPVVVHAEREDDIRTALRIADEFDLRIILDGATDAYKLAGELARRGIPVILADPFRGAGNIEDRGFDPAAAAVLAEAGVRLAFRAAEGSRWTPAAGEAGGDLLEIAAFAVKNGLDEEAALRAVTVDAAAIAGIAGRTGSLEAGKDADILILRGHPFRTKSVPEAVFIDGKLVHRRAERERGHVAGSK